MLKELGSNQEKIDGTSFTENHTGQKWRIIIGELFLNMAMKSFAIFDQDMTQTIYENYWGIFGVMEI